MKIDIDNPSEHSEQCALFAWWWKTKWHRDGVKMFAIPNGGWRHIATGRKLHDEGATRGVPDVFLAYPCRDRHGLFIEMKRRKNGTVQAEQKAMHAALSQAGYAVVICRGWDSAKMIIESYLAEAKGDCFGRSDIPEMA